MLPVCINPCCLLKRGNLRMALHRTWAKRLFIITVLIVSILCFCPMAHAYVTRPTESDWLAAEKIFAPNEVLNITITFDENPTADPNLLVDCTTDTPHI